MGQILTKKMFFSYSTQTTLNTAILEDPDMPEVNEQAMEDQVDRPTTPNVGDMVKLVCTIMRLKKIFYAMVRFPFLYF